MLNTIAIKTINKILETNQGSKQKLKSYNGKSFKLTLLNFVIYAQIDIDGFLISPKEYDFNVIINIPINAVSYLLDKDRLALYKNLTLTGDTRFGRNLLEILANLHFSEIYTKLNFPFALEIFNQIEYIFSLIKNSLNTIYKNTETSVKEYLLYETEDLIVKHEMELYCDSIDELRGKVDILENKIKNYLEPHN